MSTASKFAINLVDVCHMHAAHNQ